MAADGSQASEQLTAPMYANVPFSWTQDGSQLVYVVTHPVTQQDIWVLSVGVDRKRRPFLVTRFSDAAPALSPDGRWIGYASNESGQFEVYVQPFPNGGRRWQISTDGGAEIAWSRNGRELFYRSRDRMMAVDIA